MKAVVVEIKEVVLTLSWAEAQDILAAIENMKTKDNSLIKLRDTLLRTSY